MRRPLVPDPVHRRPRRAGPSARAIVAGLVLVAAAALLAVFGALALRGLSEIPEGSTGAAVTAEIAAASRTAADREPVTAPRSRLVPGEPQPAGGEVEESGGVRYVEGAGIAATRIEGPLVREPTTVAPPPPPPPEPTLYRLVVIEDADTINLRTRTVQLAHVRAPDADATCATASGGDWPCGMRARTALRRLVRRRALECLFASAAKAGAEEAAATPASDGAPLEANCTVAGTNLSEWLIEQGWAKPAGDAPEALKSLASEAEAAGRGMFDRDPR